MRGTRLHWQPRELLRRIEPAEMGLEYTAVQRLELDGRRILHCESEEVCLVCLSGDVAYETGGSTGVMTSRDMLYLPPGPGVELLTKKPSTLVCFSAPCATAPTGFAHFRFAEIDRDPARHKVYGKSETGCRRDVWNCIDDGFPAARLLVGFCAGAPGGWTAWPLHEHAAEREEVYVYFDMGTAFGVQLVYEDMAEPLAVALVRDGDLVSVPRGYHPSVGCPAGRISYVYCMTAKRPGERRFMDLRIQAAYGERFE